MRKHLHPFMKRRTSWKYVKHLSGRYGWVANFGLWSGSISRVNSGLKPWEGVGESGAAKIFHAWIRSHMWVKKNVPWLKPHSRRKLVTVFGRGI